MRIALKYCGGCDSGYDRAEYFRRICMVAPDSIEWATVDDKGFDGVLIISGCATACPERNVGLPRDARIVSVADDDVDPEKILGTLLR